MGVLPVEYGKTRQKVPLIQARCHIERANTQITPRVSRPIHLCVALCISSRPISRHIGENAFIKSTGHKHPAQRLFAPGRAAYSAEGRPGYDSLDCEATVIGSPDHHLCEVSAVDLAKAAHPGGFHGLSVSVR